MSDIENAKLLLGEIIDWLNDSDEEHSNTCIKIRHWVGKLQALLENIEDKSILGRRILLKPSSDILGTVVLGVKWDATGIVGDFTLLTRHGLAEQKPSGMGGPYCGVCSKDTKGIFYGNNEKGILCPSCCDERDKKAKDPEEKP